MSWDQPDLWGVKPTPAADTSRIVPKGAEDKEWPSCWNDCALCKPTPHGQQHPNVRYRIYRLCDLRDQKCFEDSLCCTDRVPFDIPIGPGWADY